jgi:hypothetical protein
MRRFTPRRPGLFSIYITYRIGYKKYEKKEIPHGEEQQHPGIKDQESTLTRHQGF